MSKLTNYICSLPFDEVISKFKESGNKLILAYYSKFIFLKNQLENNTDRYNEFIKADKSKIKLTDFFYGGGYSRITLDANANVSLNIRMKFLNNFNYISQILMVVDEQINEAQEENKINIEINEDKKYRLFDDTLNKSINYFKDNSLTMKE